MAQLEDVEIENECLRLELNQLREELGSLRSAAPGVVVVDDDIPANVNCYSPALIQALGEAPGQSDSAPVLEVLLSDLCGSPGEQESASIHPSSGSDIEPAPSALPSGPVAAGLASPSEAELNGRPGSAAEREQLEIAQREAAEKQEVIDRLTAELREISERLVEAQASVDELTGYREQSFHRQMLLDQELGRIESQVDMASKLFGDSSKG